MPQDRADFDYSHLLAAANSISAELDARNEDRVVAIVSTVLPGTIDREIRPVVSPHMKLVYNPFFIAMGTAMQDFLTPEFVLLGVDDDVAAARAQGFYATIHQQPVYRTTIRNAELIKVAYNTFIGMKIGFANTLMEFCHKRKLRRGCG